MAQALDWRGCGQAQEPRSQELGSVQAGFSGKLANSGACIFREQARKKSPRFSPRNVKGSRSHGLQKTMLRIPGWKRASADNEMVVSTRAHADMPQ